MKKYFAEMFGTMFLVLLACGSAVLAGPSIGVLGIGIALGLVNIVGIPVDNCSVNPARSFGPALFSDGCAFGDFWIMVVGPLVGAGLAVALYRLAVTCCASVVKRRNNGNKIKLFNSGESIITIPPIFLSIVAWFFGGN